MANQEENSIENDADLDTLFNQAVEAKDSPNDSDFEANDEVELSDHAEDEDTEQTEDDTSDDSDSQNETQDEEPPVLGDEEDSQEKDVFEGLSEAQREEFKRLQTENLKMQNDVRANAHRVQALNNKLAEERAAREREAEASKGEQSEGELTLEGKTFPEIEEEWPEIAQYTKAMVQQAVELTKASMRKEFEPLRNQYAEIEQQRTHTETLSELDRLSSVHPDYAEVNGSQEFRAWLGQKPVSIQSLADSMKADDNIELLNLYKFENNKFAPKQEATKESESAETDLSEHAELPRKGSRKPQAVPDDPEDLFDLIVSQKNY
jgi:hypothetical protein